ncbi:MAG: class I SAM-dependent methyltransferase [Sandaracinus sp.]|nr:class I SAM-dependent methyltransferase [Sandaracinus sp.]
MDLRERRASGGRAPQRHPWERRRAAFFGQTLASTAPAAGLRWLDAGAGDGWLAGTLRTTVAPDARLVCWDANYADDEIRELREASPGVDFVREAPSGPFDLVTAFDVLEHVEDDVAFVGTLFERLRPGGVLLVSVPAWPMLYGPHDEILAHHRRYRPREARSLLENGGFEVRRGGGLFHSLLPARVLQRLVVRPNEKLTEVPALHWDLPDLATRAILAALSADNRLSEAASHVGIDIPGLTWWAVCERPR